ncbi:uncharacterized protein [Petaurus breviceps papuanus]|uniref:uncharacterized protein n=1 Tax=Petaurus breviceps papuanus TaxID=3040969 RepID=UPI0036DB80F3
MAFYYCIQQRSPEKKSVGDRAASCSGDAQSPGAAALTGRDRFRSALKNSLDFCVLSLLPQCSPARAMYYFRGVRWTLEQSLTAGVLLGVLQFTGICMASVKMSSLNRTQEDYVLLRTDIKTENKTLLIRWYHLSKNLCLLTIWSGESSPHWIIPQKEYEGRLSTPDGESLKITNLTPEDSGLYEAHIISVSGEIKTANFNLTVFGK